MDELQRISPTHYACTGSCGGVSERPGVCEAAACERAGKPLSECPCSDGRHGRPSDES